MVEMSKIPIAILKTLILRKPSSVRLAAAAGLACWKHSSAMVLRGACSCGLSECADTEAPEAMWFTGKVSGFDAESVQFSALQLPSEGRQQVNMTAASFLLLASLDACRAPQHCYLIAGISGRTTLAYRRRQSCKHKQTWKKTLRSCSIQISSAVMAPYALLENLTEQFDLFLHQKPSL